MSSKRITGLTERTNIASGDYFMLDNASLGSAKYNAMKLVEPKWELIKEATVTNATEADIDIEVDGNGNAFELTDVRLIFCTPQQETQAGVGSPGRVRFYFDINNYELVYLGGYTQNSNTQSRTGFASVEQINGMVQRTAIRTTGNNADANIVGRNQFNVSDRNGMWELPSSPRIYNKIKIEAVTGTASYKLYGRRKPSQKEYPLEN